VARTWEKEETKMHRGTEKYETGKNIRKKNEKEYSTSYAASFYLFRSFFVLDSTVFYAACR
jgi:hypothetical protein